MTKLTVGSECIELREAKRKVRANITFLNRRIQRLHKSPPIYIRMHEQYSRKIEEQKRLLTWLEQHEESALAGYGRTG